MKLYINKFFMALGMVALLASTSCVGDLDQQPHDINQKYDITRDDVPMLLAKCYSSLATSGQDGPGSSDIGGLDNGEGQYLRAVFMMQEFPADEVQWIWDPWIYELCTDTWGADNKSIYGAYSRFYTLISVCNEFIAKSAQWTNEPEVQQYQLEARALRALAYYHAIDIFGNGSYVVEAGAMPVQKTRAELYYWLVDELQDIIKNYKESGIYGRVGLDGVKALLARVYLNGGVYTKGSDKPDTQHYAKCQAICEEIIANHKGGLNGTGLAKHYFYLFCGTNDAYAPGGSNKDENEILWTVPQDANSLQSYGSTTFLIAGASSSSIFNVATIGTSAQWGCMHATPQMADRFTNEDIRWSMWLKEDYGCNKENTVFSNLKDGYTLIKFTNLIAGTNGEWSPQNGGKYANPEDEDGNIVPYHTASFMDTDYPLFRLADVYLMYAEGSIVGKVGDASKALNYVNYVRTRAGVTPWTEADMTADNLCEERSRELYWELTRRSDLVRFGKFTDGEYLWAWKGNAANGRALDAYRNLFPIPTNVLGVQPSFKQNPGY